MTALLTKPLRHAILFVVELRWRTRNFCGFVTSYHENRA